MMNSDETMCFVPGDAFMLHAMCMFVCGMALVKIANAYASVSWDPYKDTNTQFDNFSPAILTKMIYEKKHPT